MRASLRFALLLLATAFSVGCSEAPIKTDSSDSEVEFIEPGSVYVISPSSEVAVIQNSAVRVSMQNALILAGYEVLEMPDSYADVSTAGDLIARISSSADVSLPDYVFSIKLLEMLATRKQGALIGSDQAVNERGYDVAAEVSMVRSSDSRVVISELVYAGVSEKTIGSLDEDFSVSESLRHAVLEDLSKKVGTILAVQEKKERVDSVHVQGEREEKSSLIIYK